MSLQGLISGSECAVPFNPLSQVLKHTEGDRSLQQDRVAGSSSSRLHHLPGTSAAPGTERDIALARQFFDNATSSHAAPSFVLSNHLPPPEVVRAMPPNAYAGSDLNRAWSDVQHGQSYIMPHQAGGATMSGWAQEFGASHVPAPGPSMSVYRPESQQTSYMPSGMYGRTMPMGVFGPNMTMLSGQMESLDKGKGKSRDVDFEAAFAQAAATLSSSQTQSARIEEVDDGIAELAEALGDASLSVPLEDPSQLPEDLDYGTDFQKAWANLQNSDIPPPQGDMAKWEAQFNRLMNAQREDPYDYESAMQDGYWDGPDSQGASQKMQFDDDGLPILGPYEFEAENKFLDPSSSRSALQDAKALLEQNGSLSEAALLLEAAIQQGDLGEGGYEAWLLLGEARSMDEREEAAMRALTEGMKIAQQAGAPGEGMLSLAISFTNENYERASHTMLLRWLSARFPSREIPEDVWQSLSDSTWHSHERVTDMFLELAREQYTQGNIDPDVQIGLGVLFYTNGDYDRAKDCFEAALGLRPRDYLLWNRLGSALSNGNKPEEALGAYREALQMRPTYTRAIYNVGVACLNIGAHQEAAEHFLSGLAMQESSGGAKSEQLWFTLRRVLSLMNRPDLVELAHAGTDVEVFRKEGFDF